jgi:uncharacterized membrane protein YgcG
MPAHHAFAERAPIETVQQEAPSQDSSADVPAQEFAPSSAETESVGENVLEWVFGVLILGPIVLLLMSLLLAFPTVLLAVSLVMDGGCLRYLLFGVGWLFAVFYGLLTGALVAEEILGLTVLKKPIFYVFTWGYPVAAYWGHQKLQSTSAERYRAWRQTLTGGALLGFGAGSIAGLLRSAASGFGGFGGGSFGGGGAGTSWSGASGAAGGASSTAPGSASAAAGGTSTATAGGASAGAAGSGATTVGSSAKAATVGTGIAVDASGGDETSSDAPADAPLGLWARLERWIRKFQWYHGLAFILVTLVFVPLGLGTMQALQNTKFLIFVLACVVVYGGYKLFRRYSGPSRYSGSSHTVLTTISSFRGGEASSSWS